MSDLQNNPQVSPPLLPLHHRSIWHWLVVIVAIIAVIGYFMTSYYYALWPFESLAPSNSNYLNVPDDLAGVGSPDPTTDWEIYRNEKYRFEFKYPVDIIIESCSHDCLGELDLIIGPASPSYRPPTASLIASKLSLDEYINKLELEEPGLNPRVFSKNVKKFNDIEWDLVTIKIMGNDELIEVAIAKTNNIYFYFGITSDVSNQILSTFRFTK